MGQARGIESALEIRTARAEGPKEGRGAKGEEAKEPKQAI